MRAVCVFCGSSPGFSDVYGLAAKVLGRRLVEQGLSLVYGGGSVGIMGQIADAVIEAGGQVIGVIPERLAVVELLHPGVTDMRIVDSMHTRKALMAELSDAFIALPGGYGTFEEWFEIITWAQLGIHSKPIGLLNTNGYFDHLLKFLSHSIAEGFTRESHRDLYVIDNDPIVLLDRVQRHQMPMTPKWIDVRQS